MQLIKFSLLLILLLAFYPGNAQLTGQIAPISSKVSGSVSGGYIFITQSTLDSADAYPTALCILDSVGNPVFFKACTEQISGPYTRTFIGDFKLQPSGMLSYSSQLATGGMGMYLLDSNFKIVDSIRCANGVATDGHDFLHFQDGSYHLVGTEERMMDLSGMVTNNGIPGEENAMVTGNVIQRFDAQKNQTFEWKSLDYFALSDVYSQYFTKPSELDHSHYNSIELDDDGNYILSFRHLHEITKIDSSSGQIIWRLGGKQNQFTFLGDTMKFTAQHDARRIANGNITVFDNGTYNSTPVARAIEYQLDEVNMTATVVWQFQEPNGYSSLFIGNANRLPNGNTLIDWGGAFPLSQTTSFTEVDAGGTIVLELDFIPNRYVSYRAVKHKLPFTISRPEIICDGQNMTLTAPSGYASYQWNTGAASQSITVQDTGTYQVWVEQGIGFVSSEKYYVPDIDSMCGSTDIVEINNPKIRIYPNPVSNHLFIENTGIQKTTAQIFNISGRLIQEFELNFNENNATKSIEVSQLTAGFYFLRIGNTNRKFIKN